MTDSSTNPLESKQNGYIALSSANIFPSGLAVGPYSRDDPDSIRQQCQGGLGIVTNVARARQIAREFHDWDLQLSDEVREAQ